MTRRQRAWDPERSGAALAALMKKAGISNGQLAKACSVHINTVGAWLAGDRPRQGHMIVIDSVLGLEPDDWSLLFPVTHAEEERAVEREAVKADVTDKLVELDAEGWKPR